MFEMTAEEYFKFAEQFFGKSLEISRAKNADYTGGSSDPFANFTSVEKYHISTEAGFITRMNDKLMRISSFVHQGTLQVKDESVTDTLRDLANYCCLMAGYLASRKLPDEQAANEAVPQAPTLDYFPSLGCLLVCTSDKCGGFTKGDVCKWEVVNSGYIRVVRGTLQILFAVDEWRKYFRIQPV